MSANINFNETAQEYSLYLLKEPAWHKLGQVVQEAKTSDEVIKIAHLDFEVEKIPNYVQVDDEWKKTSSYSIIRKDTGDILYSVAQSRYTPLQNIESFKYLDSLVLIEKDIVYETAGCLGKGERTFVTAKLPGYIRIGDSDDIIEEHIVFTNSHAGDLSCVFLSPTRIVCNNTLNMALQGCKNKFTLKHTSGILNRMQEIMNILNMNYIYTNKLTEALSFLATKPLTDKMATEIINSTFLTLEQQQQLANKELSTRAQNILEDVYCAVEGAPGQDMYEGMALHLYNGVTSYFQNVKEYKSLDRKMEGVILDGRESQIAQKVFNELLTF